MGPVKPLRGISQEAFDEVVRENVEDLGMDPEEALQDAIQTLSLQGVDLSGIVTCVPGTGSVRDNPVIQSLDMLTELNKCSGYIIGDKELKDMVDLLDKLTELCKGDGGSGNATIASRNGGLELVCSICSKFQNGRADVIASTLKTMSLFLNDIQSTETFRSCDGPTIVMGILSNRHENVDILNGGFSVIAAAATGNEIVKQSFMELKIDELILQILRSQRKDSLLCLYDVLRVLLTPDDNRVVASQVYGYARRFSKIGVAGALVNSLRAEPSSSGLVSASAALKAVAVNDEICKSIAENGGIDLVLQYIDESGEQSNNTVAKACCSLLSKLAGSDANKNFIVEKRGLDRLITLSIKFQDDPSVLQEVMSIITVLCLRSPDNAARALEAGAGDLAIQAMDRFPAAPQLQRNSCLMIRNLVVRNPENRTHLLSNGIEKYIREAKQNHGSCKDAASDALRDLGLDNYL